MKTYISVNIVSQALLLTSAIKKHSCDSVHKISQLKLAYGVNRDAAMLFLRQCGWIKVDNDTVSFTQCGENIAASFNGFQIDQTLWRTILSVYIEKSERAWSRRIPYGRKEAYLIMSPEEQRCFDEAGLMESTDAEVIDWWDALAERERFKRDVSHLDVGREGERFTVLYEQQRTGVTPIWVSVESNIAGYDILSCREKHSNEDVLIEVKSSQKPMEKARCIITRHEWETAQRRNNVGRYFFYLWKLSNDENLLAIVDVAGMQPYIPIDSGSGKWEEVSVPYSAFEDLFIVVTTSNQ